MELKATTGETVDLQNLKDALGQQKIIMDALKSGTWAAPSIPVVAIAMDLTKNMLAVIEQQLSDLKPKKKPKKKAAKKKTTKRK